MSARTDVDDLDVLVRRRGGNYLASIPQLGLYATADSLAAAIAALEVKKKKLVEELIAADALDEIAVAPAGPPPQPRILPSLALFSAKGVIVVILFLAVLGFARHAVQSEIDQLRAPKIGGAVFWADMESNLVRAADPANDMPAAKKQELLGAMHVLVDRWRPFVREIGRLFSDSDASLPAVIEPPAKP